MGTGPVLFRVASGLSPIPSLRLRDTAPLRHLLFTKASELETAEETWGHGTYLFYAELFSQLDPAR